MGWMEGPQARRFGFALLVAIALAFVLTAASGSGVDTAAGRLGGDYPAFYAAGRIAGDEGLDHVNDLASLRAAQADLFPSGSEEGFLTWAYPPHVALLYQPLAELPYRPSYLLHTALMAAALVAAVLLARPLVPWLRTATLPAIAAAFAFYPMFRGIGSGQNTALTLLLLVGAWRASDREHDGWAGVLLGLLLFKPQFAGLAVVAWVVGGRWRVLPSFVAMGIGTWGVTALFAGTDWVSRYLDDLDAYRATEHVNAANHVGLAEVADALGLPTAVGALLAAVLLVAVGVRWFQARPGGGVVPALAGPVAVLAPVLLLGGAHAVFYDTGLVLLTAAVLVQRGHARAAAVLWVVSLVDPLKDVFDVNPAVLLLLAWFAVAWRTTAPAPRRATIDA